MIFSHTWDDLVVHNPMLIEITRFRRRFLTLNGNNSIAAVIWSLIAVCYAGLILLVISVRSDADPMILVYIQTTLFSLAAPMTLHSSIAGERERRSWDLLLAAPITKAQIVVGKFIGALAAVGMGAAAFAIPIAICALSYGHTHYMSLWLGEAVSLSFTILVCATTLLFSARVKRSFMALGASLGTVFVGLVVIPALFAVLIGSGLPMYDDVLLYLHPFYVLTRVGGMDGSNTVLSAAWFGIPQIALYLVLSTIILGWSIQTLNFAENEVKFLPKAKP